MRVAIIVGAFPVWTETFVINQITGLIDRGCDVDIYSTQPPESESKHALIDSYRLIERTCYLGLRNRSWVGRILTVARLLVVDSRWRRLETWRFVFKVLHGVENPQGWTRPALLAVGLNQVSKRPYDVVHAQFGHLGPRILRLRQFGALKGKLVISFRGHDATQKRYTGSDVYAQLFEHGDAFFPVSRKLGDQLVALGCEARKIRVLHSGIDCRRFTFAERRLDALRVVRLASVARFVEMKGLRYAIEAVAKVVKQGVSIRYTIVGDGELRPELEAQIAELGLSEVVTLAGWKSHEDTLTILGDAHILLAPSVTAANGETEGIPNAVKEAMALGMPVLSTQHAGIPELVQDEVSGFLVPERDSEALASRLLYLLDHSERWPAMGRAGRAFVEKEFDIDKLNDLLIDYYRQ